MGYKDQAFDLIEQEWNAIRISWRTIASAVILISGSIWIILGWAYGTKIDHLNYTILTLENRIKEKDDQITAYKDKLSGATPVEAKARIDALERRLPRSIPDEKRNLFIASLIGQKGTIWIVTDNNIPDGEYFAKDLVAAFSYANWRADSQVFLDWKSATRGVSVFPLNKNDPNLQLVNSIVRNLEEVGIPAFHDPNQVPPEGFEGDIGIRIYRR